MKTLHSINAVAKKQFGSHKHASLVIYGSVLFLAPQLGSGGGKEWANAMQKCHLIPLVLYLPKLWDATLKSLFRIFKTKRKSAVGSIIMYLACLPDSDSVNGATGISKLVHRTFWALCSGGVKSVKPRKKRLISVQIIKLLLNAIVLSRAVHIYPQQASLIQLWLR